MIEPLSAAATFATVVGLIGTWKSEARGTKAETVEDYLEWLRRENHKQLANQIEGNRELMNSLHELLTGQHDAVLRKIESLNEVVCRVAGQMEEFAPLARAIGGSAWVLSDQAISILRQMNSQKAEAIMLRQGTGMPHPQLHLWPTGGELELTELRFLQDDLATLCRFNLLRLRSNGMYGITRPGARFGV